MVKKNYKTCLWTQVGACRMFVFHYPGLQIALQSLKMSLMHHHSLGNGDIFSTTKLAGKLFWSVCFNNFLYSGIVSHAGDGNFHTVIMFDPSNQEQAKEAVRLSEFMVYTALSMDGKSRYK